MSIDETKSHLIDQYIAEHNAAYIGDRPLILAGEKKSINAYRLPIVLLRYNVSNGRFALEKMEWEQKHGRTLDSQVPEDALEIRKLLLALNPTDTISLHDDLLKYGQLDPGVITYDGAVINGNRRMAVMEDMFERDGDPRFEYLDVMRLPGAVDLKDLWRLEAGLQLSQEQRVNYGPVNELLKIRDGLNAGLNAVTIANSLYGWTVKTVRQSVELLELIDEFLDLIDRPGDYVLIKEHGLTEYFINIQKVMRKQRKNTDDTGVLAERLLQAYALAWATVRAKHRTLSYNGRLSHTNIRNLTRIFESDRARASYINKLETDEEENLLNADPLLILNAYDDAMEVVKSEALKEKPAQLIDRAVIILSSLKNETYVSDVESREAFMKLTELVDELKPQYDITSPHD